MMALNYMLQANHLMLFSNILLAPLGIFLRLVMTLLLLMLVVKIQFLQVLQLSLMAHGYTLLDILTNQYLNMFYQRLGTCLVLLTAPSASVLAVKVLNQVV